MLNSLFGAAMVTVTIQSGDANQGMRFAGDRFPASRHVSIIRTVARRNARAVREAERGRP